MAYTRENRLVTPGKQLWHNGRRRPRIAIRPRRRFADVRKESAKRDDPCMSLQRNPSFTMD